MVIGIKEASIAKHKHKLLLFTSQYMVASELGSLWRWLAVLVPIIGK